MEELLIKRLRSLFDGNPYSSSNTTWENLIQECETNSQDKRIEKDEVKGMEYICVNGG
jgi:hypothetical protein